MNWRKGVAACVVGLLTVGTVGFAADTAPAPAKSAAKAAVATPAPAAMPETFPSSDVIDQATQLTDWMRWGGDVRVRQEYEENNLDFLYGKGHDDTLNQIRTRYRIWVEIGPFLSVPELSVPNGLSAYIRMTSEPRYVITSSNDKLSKTDTMFNYPSQRFDEAVYDNLYLNWVRIAGEPLSLKAGRMDLAYGRGWIILDGTPLDGSRTTYSDAIVATLHDLDQPFGLPGPTSLDLIAVSNKANENRLTPIQCWPWGKEFDYTSEYDTSLYGAYLTSKYAKNHEVNLYYFYKDDDAIKSTAPLQGRSENTAGGLLQGKFNNGFDYYFESALQWGRVNPLPGGGSGNNSIAYGVNSDIGYTFGDPAAPWRIHGGIEFLSGDNRHTSQYEGWDSVMSRWPQWSELWANRWGVEDGEPGNETNLIRPFFGLEWTPIQKLKLAYETHLLFAESHAAPPDSVPASGSVQYGDGYYRGELLVGKVFYNIAQNVNTHLWAEFFAPNTFYKTTYAQPSYFLRWEIAYTFAHSK